MSWKNSTLDLRKTCQGMTRPGDDLHRAQPLNAPGNFQLPAFLHGNDYMETVCKMESKKADGWEHEPKASLSILWISNIKYQVAAHQNGRRRCRCTHWKKPCISFEGPSPLALPGRPPWGSPSSARFPLCSHPRSSLLSISSLPTHHVWLHSQVPCMMPTMLYRLGCLDAEGPTPTPQPSSSSWSAYCQYAMFFTAICCVPDTWSPGLMVPSLVKLILSSPRQIGPSCVFVLIVTRVSVMCSHATHLTHADGARVHGIDRRCRCKARSDVHSLIFPRSTRGGRGGRLHLPLP